MSKASKFLLLIFILFSTKIFSQEINHEYFLKNGEVYFKFDLLEREELDKISKVISIDNVKDGSVFAYANERGFEKFGKLKLDYKVLPHPGDVKNVKMSNNIEEITQWNMYPTYDAYVNMMNKFQTDYPDLCRIVSAGNSVDGREILFAVISDSVNKREVEPQFMYTSTMHGDETTGYVLMLRLIDSLLTSYNSDERITELVNNIEIWINPNANPDGTYRNGNHTVSGARRYNSNGVDLNRNFPDPEDGEHPDGNAWQPENIIMMNIASQNHFTLSANFHGGAEVVNYPWDTWSGLHADDSYFINISRQYADTAHAFAPSSYMSGFQNGITNGYQWYSISGGRQDYYTYFHHCREVTIEISDTKLVPAAQLPAHWEYNKRSFLNYLEQCLKGVRGTITSSLGHPLKAKVTIAGHDFNNSQIYSDSSNGGYFRLIDDGTYTIIFEADSHITATYENVVVANNGSVELDVVLEADYVVPVELVSFNAARENGSVILNWETATETNNLGFEIERKVTGEANNQFEKIGFVEGSGTSTISNVYSYRDDSNINSGGKIVYRLKQIDLDGEFSFSNEVEIINSLPLRFELSQNFPNPFNPSTKINYSVPVGGTNGNSSVQIIIFDLLGNEIAKLVDEDKPAGNYEVIFDASHLSSGIYFYKLISGGYSISKKMLFLK